MWNKRLVWMLFVLQVGWSWSGHLACAQTEADREPPNIVLIMADDIGVECLSTYGSEMYETPNLDRLAQQGMKFLHAHAQPICTPSRVQIMTGRYNNANYIKFGLLDPEVKTFGNLMREAGYQTCIAGKWQLGGGFDGPGRFGFDHYCLWQLTRRPSRYPNPGLEIDGKQHDFKEGQFGPDVVSDYINEFISKHQQERFFVYYPMIAPHWPFVPTPDHPDWDPTMWRDAKGEPGGYRDQKYWDAMVRYTDKMVGKVVNHIDSLGLRENTLIIWTADNGTYTGIRSRYQGKDYPGGKGSTADNGTHVGFIASLPGVIPPGSESESLVDFTDVLPTLLEFAQVPVPDTIETDGVSLGPAFREKERNKPAIYCWYHRDGNRKKATEHARDARYKLYSDGRFFDTSVDMLEKQPLRMNALSDAQRDTYHSLQEILLRHTAQTDAYDEVQNAKRRIYGVKK